MAGRYPPRQRRVWAKALPDVLPRRGLLDSDALRVVAHRVGAGARSRPVWTAWCDREKDGERQRELTRGSELRC